MVLVCRGGPLCLRTEVLRHTGAATYFGSPQRGSPTLLSRITITITEKLKEKPDDGSQHSNGRLLLNPFSGFLNLFHRLLCFLHQGIIID